MLLRERDGKHAARRPPGNDTDQAELVAAGRGGSIPDGSLGASSAGQGRLARRKTRRSAVPRRVKQPRKHRLAREKPRARPASQKPQALLTATPRLHPRSGRPPPATPDNWRAGPRSRQQPTLISLRRPRGGNRASERQSNHQHHYNRPNKVVVGVHRRRADNAGAPTEATAGPGHHPSTTAEHTPAPTQPRLPTKQIVGASLGKPVQNVRARTGGCARPFPRAHARTGAPTPATTSFPAGPRSGAGPRSTVRCTHRG